LRYAARALRNSPWFAALAIVTLSLGTAVNTSIFSVVNGFILRPLPVPQPEQLAVLSLQQAGDHSLQKFSYPDYVDLRDQSASFSEIIAYRITLAGLAADNRGDHCIVTRVSGNYFPVLGVQPALGKSALRGLLLLPCPRTKRHLLETGKRQSKRCSSCGSYPLDYMPALVHARLTLFNSAIGD
jgi:hypothetical protein